MMEKLLKMLEELGEDVSFDLFEHEDEDSILYVTVEDCEGFNEDWCEVEREYDADAVQTVIAWLETNCVSCKDCYSIYYYFEGFVVHFSYASYDI